MRSPLGLDVVPLPRSPYFNFFRLELRPTGAIAMPMTSHKLSKDSGFPWPSPLAAPIAQMSKPLGPAYQRWSRRVQFFASVSSDRRRRRRSETDGFLMVGQIPQPLPCSAHSPPTPGALSKHRDHWRCSPAAQSCASRVPCSAAPPQPHSGPSAEPAPAAVTCPDEVWDFQHQSCLETTRDYATVACPSKSHCLNLGARHFVSQCRLPGVSIFFRLTIDDYRRVWQAIRPHVNTNNKMSL
ncbi:hypothetical protein B0T18DRAFT_54232 [Schizothecium vesticola]|uniref:Uncharacterized protein n=1 Tax=Schizothecium vesticola TaxID=314040 RepID=A0AA40KDG4_9PEZI|nr:hypothetical protein B0T18DRAFT_54232 [Schizothecium vesticola]